LAGCGFAESAHIKDALAFLRVVDQPSDTLSWFRRLKLIDHIGDATVYQILEHLGVDQRSFARANHSGAVQELHRFPGRAVIQAQLTRLARVFTTVLRSKTPSEATLSVLRSYRPMLKNKYDDVQRRRPRSRTPANRSQRRYKTAAKLLEGRRTRSDRSVQGMGLRNGGRLCDAFDGHSRKGLEWDNLFVIWMTDWLVPREPFSG
jgi:DNA helicase-2/ATP-dependent DNA helicase PcrA